MWRHLLPLLAIVLWLPSWLSAQVAEQGKTEDVVDLSLLQATGLLTPLSPHNLRLDSLHLQVDFDGEDFALVTAHYLLQNHGPGGYVSMGLPFDVVHRLPFYTVDWAAEHLPDLTIRIDGEDLAVRSVQQKLPIRRGYPRFRHWRRVEVPVPDSGGTVDLTADFRMRLELNDFVPLASTGEARPSPRTFNLSLRPDTVSFRHARTLETTLDTRALKALGIRVLDRDPRLVADSTATQYTWKAQRVNLDSLPDLRLSYDVRDYQRSAPYRTPFPDDFIDSCRTGLPDQDPDNLLDANRRTVWRVDSTLAQAWWEVTFHDLPLATVSILNGCPEAALGGSSFAGWADEVLITATCLDAPKGLQTKWERRVRLRAGSLQPLSANEVPGAVQTLLSIPDPPGVAWRVRLQVTRFYPGQRWACLPEIYLLP